MALRRVIAHATALNAHRPERLSAISAATAHDARRDRTESARLVRIDRHPGAKHDYRPSQHGARKVQTLGQHVAGLEVRRQG